MSDAHIDSRTTAAPASLSVLAKRNCSISPHALFGFLGFTALFCLGIGVGFAWVGAWLILPFAGLEIAALAAALYAHGRHATDYERIVLVDDTLEVERCVRDRIERRHFNARWVYLMIRKTRFTTRLALRSHGCELEIGRHLDTAGRERLAAELRARLAHARKA